MGNIWDFDVTIRAETSVMGTHAATIPRPDVEAHRKATQADFPAVVESLVALIGRKLTAYIASIKDARAIDRWLHEQVRPQRDVEARLRLAYHIAAMLSEFDTPAVIQAWLLGLNPELDDAVPISLLRDGDMEIDGKKVLNAARAFVAGG